MTWDPETEQQNRRRELSIAKALLRGVDDEMDLRVVRRLVRAAAMHLETLEQSCPQNA